MGELRNELLEMLGKTSPNKLLLLPKKKKNTPLKAKK